MKKMITLLAILISGTFTMQGQAQTKLSTVQGTVQDEIQKTFESASATLLRAKDSSLVKTTVTDKSGRFQFENITPGKYLVSITAVGYSATVSPAFEVSKSLVMVNTLVLQKHSDELKAVAITSKKLFFEQKADRMVVNVDASPANTGTSVLELLERSPGVSIDKDGNISLKGKQGVTVMIDNKPTYLNSTQLANYLKSLPSSAVEQLEIMTNPSAKYDAAGNSGIINIKTKKNKVKGFNGSLTLTETQGVYAKPGASLNLNYRTGKFNFFVNAGYTYWQGFQNLQISRTYLDASNKTVNSIFTQETQMKFVNPEFNLKLGLDYYLSNRTTLGFVVSGFRNLENVQSESNINLLNPQHQVDSIVYSPSTNNSTWKNGSVNLNFRHQFDSSGSEITADLDYMNYMSSSNQYFNNITYDPNWVEKNSTVLTGYLPSTINIYSFKTDYTRPMGNSMKLEAGLKTSFVSTSNDANYYNIENNKQNVDTGKTNHFIYKENINAAYVNLSRQLTKWNFQLGLRLENTNYSGHQLGNPYTVVNNDSSFSQSYVNLFPTLYVSYQANEKNQFAMNYGRRIDRPAYEDLNPFLFFLDQYTYQAGNPYLQPQYTNNIEFSHTYNNFLTTTINYSDTRNFFTETFEQLGHATIVRKGNIGRRQNAGIAMSAQIPVRKWWMLIAYANYVYNKFDGTLYGERIDVAAPTFLANLNNQFRLPKGWGAELSGFYRSQGVEGQIVVDPLGQVSAAITRQLFHEKANLKLAVRDIFYTQQVTGYINFQETEATFHNRRDSRQVSLSFTYRFGKPFKGPQPRRNAGGASEESNRVKTGGNN
ncbi:MAG: TonB-dependent receptor domain-containing protein [Chitinophagales bacterium]